MGWGVKQVSIGNRIRRLRERAGLTQEELALRLKLTRTTIIRYEKGRISISAEMLERIADALGVQVTDFYPSVSASETDHGPWEMVPVFDDIPAGGLRMTEDDEATDFVMTSTSELKGGKARYFYLRVNGDSMEPLIPNHSLVFVRHQDTVENDEVAVVSCRDQGATLKRVHLQGNMVALIPENRTHATIMVNAAEARIIGKVLAVRYDISKSQDR
jgi:SOS-response transcriptional repressor LexA